MTGNKAARRSCSYEHAKERHSGRTGTDYFTTEFERGSYYAAWIVGVGFGLMFVLSAVMF